MPSFEHELLVMLLSEHPDLVLGLLADVGLLELDDLEARCESENLSSPVPVEFRADSLLLVRRRGRPEIELALVVEVQLGIDDAKRYSWPAYLAIARARWRCPAAVVVLSTDAGVARWCARPIDLGLGVATFRPLVIGPSGVPVVDLDVATATPDLAILSFLAHRDTAHELVIARALLTVAARLDGERGRLYTDIVFTFLSAASRAALEAEMNLEKYQVRSDFMRRLEAEAIELGRQEGREEGREVARLALARALVALLEGRGFEPDHTRRATIDACRDIARLDAWLLRAAIATDLASVFADET